MSTIFDVEIIGGPQDGGQVRQYRESIAPTIWIGNKWMGDGNVAYTTHGPSSKNPVECAYDGRVYKYVKTYSN